MKKINKKTEQLINKTVNDTLNNNLFNHNFDAKNTLLDFTCGKCNANYSFDIMAVYFDSLHNKEKFLVNPICPYCGVRENFKSLCDKVFRGETLIVSRPKNENIVMMSESEYNEIMKAKRNAEYLAMLDKSMAEAEAGGFITKTVDELGAYE